MCRTSNQWPADKNEITVAITLMLFYFILHILNIGCPIKFITGISCAGCGMTRAWLHVLNLEFAEAMRFHPLFWSVPSVGILLLYRKKIPRNVVRMFFVGFILLFLAVYIIRMMNPEDTVVEINFNESFIWKIMKRVRKLLW